MPLLIHLRLSRRDTFMSRLPTSLEGPMQLLRRKRDLFFWAYLLASLLLIGIGMIQGP